MTTTAWLPPALPSLPADASYYLTLLAALRQWHVVASADSANGNGRGAAAALLPPLLEALRAAERFYDVLGGVAGYQLTALELMAESCAAAAAHASQAETPPPETAPDEADEDAPQLRVGPDTVTDPALPRSEPPITNRSPSSTATAASRRGRGSGGAPVHESVFGS